jgi:ubiquinone biosynthesis protein COQ9
LHDRWIIDSLIISHFCCHMAEFRDTWTFVERRIKDALNLQKSVNEVAYITLPKSNCISYSRFSLIWNNSCVQAGYLAEAMGAGLGVGPIQGILNKVFQKWGKLVNMSLRAALMTPTILEVSDVTLRFSEVVYVWIALSVTNKRRQDRLVRVTEKVFKLVTCSSRRLVTPLRC